MYRRMLDPPLLVLLDLQREYLADGRPLCIPDVQRAISNCRRLLEIARAQSWLVAHCFMRGPGALFAEGAEFTRPIEGFHPTRNEHVFYRSALSAYGSQSFARLLDSSRSAPTFLAGLSAPFSILATLYDAYSHRHRLALVRDATAAPRVGDTDNDNLLRVTLEIAAMVAPATVTDDVCGEDPFIRTLETRLGSGT